MSRLNTDQLTQAAIDNLSAAPDPSGEADLVRGDEKIIIAAEQGGLKDAFKRAKKLSGTGLRWVVINREDVFAANTFSLGSKAGIYDANGAVLKAAALPRKSF